MIKSIIIEDNKIKSNQLNALLKKHFPEVEVLTICNNLKEGVRKVLALQPELLFLDVELDEGYNGFDLLSQTQSVNYKVIFTTSYNRYAARAFRFSAIDYIEGDCDEKLLNEAISKYKVAVSGPAQVNQISTLLHNAKYLDMLQRQKIGIPVDGILEFIHVSDIILCESKDCHTTFYLTKKRTKYVARTLKWVEELIDIRNEDYKSVPEFYRVHGSYLINFNQMVKFKHQGEAGMVEMAEQLKAPVSRRIKGGFLKALEMRKMISRD